jgi:hypothetical protein
MTKQNILRITLFVSVLAFNPAVAQVLHGNVLEQTRQQQRSGLGRAVAQRLEAKGLETDAAAKIASDFMDAHHGSLDMMAMNILQQCPQIDKAQMVAYLSDEALHRRSVALHEYAQLSHLFNKVTGSMPDEAQRNRLMQIAKLNQGLMNT